MKPKARARSIIFQKKNNTLASRCLLKSKFIFMEKFIIANWKMQLTIKESLDLAKKIVVAAKKAKNEIVICSDYSALPFIGPILRSTSVKLGAQDSAAFIKGAYTGEVSPLNLKALGVKYVILGHSERREHLHENSAIINNKIKAALASKLIPILCVGEKLIEKQNGQTKDYLKMELRHALKGVKIHSARDLIVAYEPIWAISTNKNAKSIEPQEANDIQGFIAQEAKRLLKQPVQVIYGGSVDSKNAASFLAQTNISGLLVGGASLKAAEFSIII